MSLINLQTGTSADTEKIISDLQTRIYKQDLLIRKLNKEANQMQRQSCSLKSIVCTIALPTALILTIEKVLQNLGVKLRQLPDVENNIFIRVST